MVTCMAKKKGIRRIVTIECTEAKNESATPSRYTTQVSAGLRLALVGSLAAPAPRCARAPQPASEQHAPPPPGPQKNTKNTPERLELMKYNPFLRRHTLHRELKK